MKFALAPNLVAMTALPAHPQSLHPHPRLFFSIRHHAKKLSFSQLTLALLLIALLLRVLASALVPLAPEEAYYWMYAQNPNLSYFDHPPMVAWCITLGTFLFGNTQFGVRFIAQLLMFGSSLLLYSFARPLFGRKPAMASSLALQVLPVYFGMGFIATMDSALLFFWLATLNAVTLALRPALSSSPDKPGLPLPGAETAGAVTPATAPAPSVSSRRWPWYLAGALFGAALLSKYTAIFLAPGLILALLLHRPWRKHLRSPHPYLAFLLALAVFSPVLFWNAQHDFASFRFQFLNRFKHHGVSLENVALFALLQIAVLTPVPLTLSWLYVVRQCRTLRSLLPWERARAHPRLWPQLAASAPTRTPARTPARNLTTRTLPARHALTLAFSLPLMAVMAYKSLRYEIHLNWTAPLFLSLLPALASLALSIRRKGFKAPFLANIDLGLKITTVVCLSISIGFLLFLLTLQPRTLALSPFGPWQQLASIVERHEQALEDATGREPLIIADGKYRLASILAFYRTPLETKVPASRWTTSQWVTSGSGLGYEYWSARASWTGRDCIYLTDNAEDLSHLTPFFDSVQLIDDPALDRYPRYQMALCRNLHPTKPSSAR